MSTKLDLQILHLTAWSTKEALNIVEALNSSTKKEGQNMDDQTQVELDRQKAEVFDALGHPTRILILKVLSEGALGFADLKKKTAIESSGHLQHHLSKLNGLVKTDEYGKYCLSDEGKDALLTVQTVENASPKKETKANGHRHLKIGLKPVAFLLAILLIASSVVAVYEYHQATVFQNKFNMANSIAIDAMTYYSEFGVIPTTTTNSSYTPPVSMYRALQLALEGFGFNKTSVSGMIIDARLNLFQTTTNGTLIGNTALTNIPSDYSVIVENGIMYRYVWVITIENPRAAGEMVSFIDASPENLPPICLH